jgi:hypothetical protein
VVQEVPTPHALRVVSKASKLARQLEKYDDSDSAPPNTLSCGDYGGCWYRQEGHCTAKRHWGAILKQIEREKDEPKMALSFNDLKKKTEAAAPAKANKPTPAAKPAKAPKPTPAATPTPVVEEEGEDETEDNTSEPGKLADYTDARLIEYLNELGYTVSRTWSPAE